MDDDDLQCVLHVSGDAKHSGDTVFLLNRHGKLLELYIAKARKKASKEIQVS